MNIQCISNVGKQHAVLNQKSQDMISVRQNSDGITAVVVCDGASYSPHSGKAAELVCEVVSEYLLSDFIEGLYQEEHIFKRKLILKLEERLLDWANAQNIPTRELSTTICAVAIDSLGRFICLHLGDGKILWKRKEKDNIEYISSPENGIIKPQTYLTMNCNMLKHLRVYKWFEDNVEKIIIATDGIASDSQDDSSCVIITLACELTNDEYLMGEIV